MATAQTTRTSTKSSTWAAGRATRTIPIRWSSASATSPTARAWTCGGCQPCSGSNGVGSATPRWIVARVDVPSFPYRIDAIGAVAGGPSAVTLVYFEHHGLAPPADPVMLSVEVEASFSDALRVAPLPEPLIIEESERLFVGIHLGDIDDNLAACDEIPEGDPQVWIRDDPPKVFPWQALLDVAPQLYAYGAPA